MALRWGIVGVGQISHDFCTALSAPGFENDQIKHSVIAVGSRNLDRSKEFAQRHNIKNYYGTYDEVAQNSDVEIVYVANLNNLHIETCLKMLQYGKHILCEKPLCMNYQEAYKVIKMAEKKNLFIMEGVWSRFFPVYEYLRNLLKNDKDLSVKEVFIKHGFKGDNVDRVSKKDLGGGIILDIGVYAIQCALMIFGNISPRSIIVKNSKINSDGVDMFVEFDLKFDETKVAHIICSGLEQLENKAVIVTNKGVITIPTYWCPTEIINYDNDVKKFPIPELVEGNYVHFINSLGLRYEADAVYNCIRSGKLSSDIIPPKDSLLIAQIQDEIRKQIN
ncbi:trans-1,2-dihydrobenzene-1,2-diol dehydrogenase-like [Condylostylus longicornis]|uniref:trans-1,2-dihydrobenzene-1,2-diol dehydrogenase-like n=1 Tax=Condylostylus longicornis TaxID=2530218 RepID=UPI00244E488A|nr:trans-1,2-dihydrobenzene-1,2-diol dehydrogenase-like [Condylostylus longicornis]